VVLAAYPDPATGRAWLPGLASVAGSAAFVGAVGPALPGGDRYAVRLAAVPADWTETVLAVVSPQATAALCVRPGTGDEVDLVLTHDPDLVHAVGRMLLARVGNAAAEAPVAAARQPIA
jgi:hypothetical protein